MDPELVESYDVPCPANANVTCAWGSGSELHFVPLAAGSDGMPASQIRWGTLEEEQKRIAYDSLPIYSELRAILQDAPQAEWRLLQKTACARLAGLLPSPSRRAPGDELIQELSADRTVWELLQIIVGSADDTRALTEELGAWLRRNLAALQGQGAAWQDPDQLCERLEASSVPAQSSPDFWPAVLKAAALGWTDDALQLIGLHPAWLNQHATLHDPIIVAQLSILEPALLLLRTMPRWGQDSSLATWAHLQSRRQQWQTAIVQLTQNAGLWEAAAQADADTMHGIRTMLDILLGSPDAVREATSTWLERLLAFMHHVYPGLLLEGQFGMLVDQCYESLPPASGTLELAFALLQAASEGDLHTIVNRCSNAVGDWFMCHVLDLLALHPAGPALLEQSLPGTGSTVGEFYTLQYAAALASTPSMWSVAAQYLAWCPQHGAAAMRSLLERVPLSPAGSLVPDEKLARHVLHYARLHDLPEAANSICRTAGAGLLAAGHTAAALPWLWQADGSAALHQVAAQLQAKSQDLDVLAQSAQDMQFALQTVQPGILASSVPEQASTLPEFLLCFLAFHNALLRCKLGETAEKDINELRHSCLTLTARQSLATDDVKVAIMTEALAAAPASFRPADVDVMLRTLEQEQVQWQTCHKAAQQLPGLRLALAQALSAAYLVAA